MSEWENEESNWFVIESAGGNYYDDDEWKMFRPGDKEDLKADRDKERDRARQTIRQHNVKAAHNHIVNYTAGSGVRVEVKLKEPDSSGSYSDKVTKQAKAWIDSVLEATHRGWTPRECAERLWRDGEVFTRKFPSKSGGMPHLRFLDPEYVNGGDDDSETHGIVTAPNDVADIRYFQYRPEGAESPPDNIEADDVFFLKIGTDSTIRRGRSLYADLGRTACDLQQFSKTEVRHRRIQASLVLHRKIQGGQEAAGKMLDAARAKTTMGHRGQPIDLEQLSTGSVLTTNQNVELEFKQPKSEFTDASRLAKHLKLEIAADTGVSYEVVSRDSEDSTAVGSAEVATDSSQNLKQKQQVMVGYLTPIIRWIVEEGVKNGEIAVEEKALWSQYVVEVRCASPEVREPLKDSQRINLAVMNQSMSRAEASRQQNLDPVRMRAEVQEEAESGAYNSNFSNQNPTVADKQSSSSSNAQASGTNQGSGEPISHKDSRNDVK